MFRILKFLITGSWHEHKWVVISVGTVNFGGHSVGNRYTLRCSECGNIKYKECW